MHTTTLSRAPNVKKRTEKKIGMINVPTTITINIKKSRSNICTLFLVSPVTKEDTANDVDCCGGYSMNDSMEKEKKVFGRKGLSSILSPHLDKKMK